MRSACFAELNVSQAAARVRALLARAPALGLLLGVFIRRSSRQPPNNTGVWRVLAVRIFPRIRWIIVLTTVVPDW